MLETQKLEDILSCDKTPGNRCLYINNGHHCNSNLDTHRVMLGDHLLTPPILIKQGITSMVNQGILFLDAICMKDIVLKGCQKYILNSSPNHINSYTLPYLSQISKQKEAQLFHIVRQRGTRGCIFVLLPLENYFIKGGMQFIIFLSMCKEVLLIFTLFLLFLLYVFYFFSLPSYVFHVVIYIIFSYYLCFYVFRA